MSGWWNDNFFGWPTNKQHKNKGLFGLGCCGKHLHQQELGKINLKMPEVKRRRRIRSELFFLKISWKSVVSEFFKLLKQSLTQSSTTKILLHVIGVQLDSSDRYEDFKEIILLDCLIACIRGTDGLVTSEGFNQVSALHESVCLATSQAWVLHCESKMQNGVSIEDEAFPENIVLWNIEKPWDSCLSLKSYARRGVEKKVALMATLCETDTCRDSTLTDIIETVVSQCYTEVSVT